MSFAAGMAAAAMIILAVYLAVPRHETTGPPLAHRFVIYAPDVSTVGISGTFTGWDVVPLTRLGHSGYWEARLILPQGEHRFSYVMEGGRRLPDPTVLLKEHDDFGGVNSILQVAPTST
jgi:1,4-alpha-glucan branching enzyme